MNGKRIGYIRVSTHDQKTARQLHDETLDKVFLDEASGKNTNRPQLKEMLQYLREGDTLVVHSMDRLARNLLDLLKMVRVLTRRGVTIIFKKENTTFNGENDAIANLMLSIMGAIAEFERELINERIREGVAIAHAAGKYKGRKPAVTSEQVDVAKARIKLGVSVATIARDLGIHRTTLYSYL